MGRDKDVARKAAEGYQRQETGVSLERLLYGTAESKYVPSRKAKRSLPFLSFPPGQSTPLSLNIPAQKGDDDDRHSPVRR